MTEVHSGGPTMGLELLTADQDSLALVAALLVEEIQAQTDARYAEQLQWNLLQQQQEDQNQEIDSSNSDQTGGNAKDDDKLFSLKQQLECINSTLSKNKIVSLCTQETKVVADKIRAQQLSQQFEATTRKERLDYEFAKALEESDRCGRDSDRLARDGVEAVLGENHVHELMRHPEAMMEQGGAAGGSQATFAEPHHCEASGHEYSECQATAPNEPLPTCSICFESVTPTSDPYSAALRSTSSSQVIHGMYLGPKEHGHVICLECFGAYVKNRLEDGVGKAFPMKCVEANCTYVLTDEDARLGLGEQNLEAWYYRKLADAQPSLYCPNRSCSARVVLGNEVNENPQAECPQCHVLMCVPCKSVWHERYTCEQFQSLPPGERDPEDIALFDVARKEGYSRCPGCRALMGLTDGCYHMTCPCGVESCYLCGLPWSRQPNERVGRCSRQPPCPLADERHLLRPENRDRDPALFAVVPQQVAPIPPAVPVAAQAQGYNYIQDGYGLRRARRFHALRCVEDGLGPFHNSFSTRMRRDIRCGYCPEYFHNHRQLRDHLADLPHSVFECCGTLFRTLYDINQHANTGYAGLHDPHRWIVPHDGM